MTAKICSKTNFCIDNNYIYFVTACHDVTWDTYEEVLQHLIHVHKVCRKFYEATEAQPQPTSSAEPENIVNVSTPEAFSEVVEIDPQVS